MTILPDIFGVVYETDRGGIVGTSFFISNTIGVVKWEHSIEDEEGSGRNHQGCLGLTQSCTC